MRSRHVSDVCAVGRRLHLIARVPLAAVGPPTSNAPAGTTRPAAGATDDGTLTIAEAKARLARTLGVDPSNIKITVEA